MHLWEKFVRIVYIDVRQYQADEVRQVPIVKKQSLVDLIYEQLKQSIISLEFPMGSKINANELQETYGVSTTPIREAINRLQQEGLILYENNVGARVVTIDEADAREIDDLAIILHKAAVRFAIKRGDCEAIAEELEWHVKAQERATTPREVVESIYGFIGTFYKYCGNSRLDFNMKVIQGQQLMLRYLYRREVGMGVRHLDVFRQICEAVRQKDSETVVVKLQEWSDGAMPTVLAAIRRDQESVPNKR